MTHVKSTLMLLLVFFFVSVSMIQIKAQGTKVISIEYGGSQVGQTNLVVIEPKQKQKNTTVYSNNTIFPSGTKIVTPGSTTVEIGANNNQQKITPNTVHEVILTAKGEVHKTIRGKVLHYINYNPKGYSYRASGNKEVKKGSVVPQTTVFSVEVENEKAKYETIKGQITAFEQVHYNVQEASKNNTSKRNRPITATKSQTISAGESAYLDDDIDEIDFYTYEEALAELQSQFDDYTSYTDLEQIADNNLAIGELYLDDDDPDTAIDYFNKALDSYYQLEFEEMSIAETQLLMAEAYYMLNYPEDSRYYASQAIENITPILEFNIMDYNFAVEDGDYYLADEIAYDLFYNYDYMGWAYELLNDLATADYYYELADSLPVDIY